jgi:hypothetical protein
MSDIHIGAVSATSPVQGNVARGQSSPAVTFTPSEQYVAQVVDSTDGKSVTVAMQGVLLNMALGEGLTPGQLVTLKFLGSNPTPTFLVIQAAGLETSSGVVEVSPAGVAIAQFLEKNQALGAHPRVLETELPLISKPDHPDLMAQELKQAIAQSGLFYESHLADYTLGKLSIEQLLQEPQNGVDFDPSELVTKQLDVYENHSVRWAGSVWPGQIMQWDTRVDLSAMDPNRDSDPSKEGANITSTLELDLPNLKKVVAKISLRQGFLSLDIRASDPVALEQLKKQVSTLALALSETGQTLESCSVNPYEQQ